MAYPQPPPPYSEKPYSTATYPAAGTTVVVNPQPTTTQHRSNRGFFGNMRSGLDSLGKSISGAIEDTANEFNKLVDNTWPGPILSMFTTQNIVQLVSRSSGHSLQIVADARGQLVVDGLGGLGQQAYNAVWTVISEGSNQVRLYNGNNYLAIINGATVVVPVTPTTPMGVETKLQLGAIGSQFITLESVKTRGKHVGILPSGELKSALATGKEMHAQFGVKMIYSPYPPPPTQGK